MYNQLVCAKILVLFLLQLSLFLFPIFPFIPFFSLHDPRHTLLSWFIYLSLPIIPLLIKERYSPVSLPLSYSFHLLLYLVWLLTNSPFQQCSIARLYTSFQIVLLVYSVIQHQITKAALLFSVTPVYNPVLYRIWLLTSSPAPFVYPVIQFQFMSIVHLRDLALIDHELFMNVYVIVSHTYYYIDSNNINILILVS